MVSCTSRGPVSPNSALIGGITSFSVFRRTGAYSTWIESKDLGQVIAPINMCPFSLQVHFQGPCPLSLPPAFLPWPFAATAGANIPRCNLGSSVYRKRNKAEPVLSLYDTNERIRKKEAITLILRREWRQKERKLLFQGWMGSSATRLLASHQWSRLLPILLCFLFLPKALTDSLGCHHASTPSSPQTWTEKLPIRCVLLILAAFCCCICCCCCALCMNSVCAACSFVCPCWMT